MAGCGRKKKCRKQWRTTKGGDDEMARSSYPRWWSDAPLLHSSSSCPSTASPHFSFSAIVRSSSCSALTLLRVESGETHSRKRPSCPAATRGKSVDDLSPFSPQFSLASSTSSFADCYLSPFPWSSASCFSSCAPRCQLPDLLPPSPSPSLSRPPRPAVALSSLFPAPPSLGCRLPHSCASSMVAAPFSGVCGGDSLPSPCSFPCGPPRRRSSSSSSPRPRCGVDSILLCPRPALGFSSSPCCFATPPFPPPPPPPPTFSSSALHSASSHGASGRSAAGYQRAGGRYNDIIGLDEEFDDDAEDEDALEEHELDMAALGDSSYPVSLLNRANAPARPAGHSRDGRALDSASSSSSSSPPLRASSSSSSSSSYYGGPVPFHAAAKGPELPSVAGARVSASADAAAAAVLGRGLTRHDASHASPETCPASSRRALGSFSTGAAEDDEGADKKLLIYSPPPKRRFANLSRVHLILCFSISALLTALLTGLYVLVQFADLRTLMQTTPAQAAQHVQMIAFGSCLQRPIHQFQPVWSSLIACRPDVWVMLGDLVYAAWLDVDCQKEEFRNHKDCNCARDALKAFNCLHGDVEAGRERYVQQMQQPDYLRFVNFMCPHRAEEVGAFDSARCQRPFLGVYDDHDLGYNDYFKHLPHGQAFRNFFLDAIGEPRKSARRSELAGIQQSVKLNSKDPKKEIGVFLLDERFYRDPQPCNINRARCEADGPASVSEEEAERKRLGLNPFDPKLRARGAASPTRSSPLGAPSIKTTLRGHRTTRSCATRRIRGLDRATGT
eukprot:GHVT01069270.1.p1 GENE.GHVT01069270.1~~GHVT01069270.1.p1  ORF type:complete len:786 (-),score=227.63 GHVT01069270.1:1387-3744(-)